MHEERDRVFTENIYAELISAISVSNSEEAQGLIIMISPAQLEQLLKKNNCEIFRNSVRNGLLDIVNQLIDKAPAELQKRMLRALDYVDWTTLALTGDFSIVNRLSEFAPNILQENFYDFFSEAAKNGHLSVLERLIELAPNKLQQLIEFANCKAFRTAAANGHLSVIERLIELAPDQVQQMIKSISFYAFCIAAENGHLSVLERLIELAPDKVKQMIESHYFYAFRYAAENGHLSILERLIELAPDKVQQMIEFDNFYVFRYAASNCHLSVLERLIELAPGKVQQMVESDNFYAFRFAASYGHLSVIERLIELAPDKEQQMIESGDFQTFHNAASYGHLSLIERLMELAPDKVQEMIESDNFAAFRFAASNGHLSLIERLMELAPDKVQEMIESDNFEAFRYAASNGHLSILEKLMELAPDKVQEMIESDNFAAFHNAAIYGHLSVLERLIDLMADKAQQMIEFDDFYAFRKAASNGQFSAVEKLIEYAPDKAQQMIESEKFQVFYNAAEFGHLSALERLMELAPDKVQQMIETNNFAAFRSAASNGHLSVLERLMELAPDKVQQMIKCDNFTAFRIAASNGHLQIANRLISFPIVFAYAELHQREYGQIVQSFLQSILTDLRREKGVFSEQNLNVVFDTTDAEQANLYFYMIRNIIRRNDEALLDDLRLLLDIPAVKNLAHLAVTPHEPNELLRLALSTDNQGAAGILLNIPAVRVLAEQNNYYRNERRGGFDLRALAQDRESSMRVLSTGEQKRLAAAINLYQPLIKAAGVAIIIADLRTQLEARYMTNQASITRDNGEILKLPIRWDEFQALNLSANERAQAFKAYYQNKDHTAWRYLSKPNPWMAENAAYVYVNDEHTERWSTFEEYLPEISMFYLAAIDKDIPAIDGHTLDTRFNHFIDELAMIGRAHNWDDTREVARADGQIIREEYDNLQGDKPSCFSGVKRRLFQSVLGHPLLKILTRDDIKQMLREYMREHFQSHITDDNREALALAWNKVVEEGIIDEEALKTLDASEEEQAAILELFSKHQYYGAQFREEPSFRGYVTTRFKSTPHAAYFGGETDLNSLLANQAQEETKEETLPEIKDYQVSKQDLLAVKRKLTSFGETGLALLDEIQCLERGSKSQSNILWRKAPEKLHALVNAIQELKNPDDLQKALLDDTSKLRIALEIKVGPQSSQAPDEKFICAILAMTNPLRIMPK